MILTFALWRGYVSIRTMVVNIYYPSFEDTLRFPLALASSNARLEAWLALAN